MIRLANTHYPFSCHGLNMEAHNSTLVLLHPIKAPMGQAVRHMEACTWCFHGPRDKSSVHDLIIDGTSTMAATAGHSYTRNYTFIFSPHRKLYTKGVVWSMGRVAAQSPTYVDSNMLGIIVEGLKVRSYTHCRQIL